MKRFLAELTAVGQLAFVVIVFASGCSFLAPSDEELVGGRATDDDASDGGESDAADGSLGAADDTSESEGSLDGAGGVGEGGEVGARPDGGDAGARPDGGDAGPRPDAGPVPCPAVADCAIPACEGAQCGSATTQRCCSRTCVDTTTDSRHCQGCGLACVTGQRCILIVDMSGSRGHCTCAATSDCPHQPAQICRSGNGDGQDGLCACDLANYGNSGCAPGQTCSDVPAANFCHY